MAKLACATRRDTRRARPEKSDTPRTGERSRKKLFAFPLGFGISGGSPVFLGSRNLQPVSNYQYGCRVSVASRVAHTNRREILSRRVSPRRAHVRRYARTYIGIRARQLTSRTRSVSPFLPFVSFSLHLFLALLRTPTRCNAPSFSYLFYPRSASVLLSPRVSRLFLLLPHAVVYLALSLSSHDFPPFS